MGCEHDISERETATVADGLCPLCLGAENTKLRERVRVLERETCPICLRAENERLKAELAKRGE